MFININFFHKKIKKENITDENFEVKVHFSEDNYLSSATCILWGLDHFQTFDGTKFQFVGE